MGNRAKVTIFAAAHLLCSQSLQHGGGSVRERKATLRVKRFKKIEVIINPIAGVRPKDEIPAMVCAALPAQEFSVAIHFTERAGHASELARRAVGRGAEVVVAIGGDGTVNETARSLVDTRTALGVVPMGSGNGLARHVQIPLEIGRALAVIREGHVEEVDYGTVNGHIFFCTAGIGFDAEVSRRFAEVGKRGGFTYVQNVIDLLAGYKPSTYTLYGDDGRVREKAFLIAIGNAAQYGNNAYITPRASIQDGMMDVTLVRPFNLIDAPQMAVQLFSRNIDENSHILSLRSARFRIIMPRPNVVHVDGEPVEMDAVLDVQTHCAGLRVLTSATPSHNLLEPFQYAIEEIHYGLVHNIKGVVNEIRRAVDNTK